MWDLFFLAVQTAVLTIPPAPPPPIVTAPVRPSIISWVPGSVRCGETVVDGSGIVAPSGELRSLPVQSDLSTNLRFAIDAGGRPHSIARLGNQTFRFGSDIAPSLAASRFPAGAPQTTCIVRYEAAARTVEESSLEELVRFSVQPGAARLPREGADRITAQSDCLRPPRPQPLILSYPDHRAVPEIPGQFEWTVIGFDIASDGTTTQRRVRMGTDNDTLNAAAIDAVANSKFADGNRTGCIMPFVRRAGTLTAPPVPEDREDEQPDICGGDQSWATSPRLTYPEAYRRRSIEGWALMAYDVAPWGEIGNIRVVESQPSDDFGLQARTILRMAKVKEGAGASGCTQLVRFEMKDDGSADSAANAAETS